MKFSALLVAFVPLGIYASNPHLRSLASSTLFNLHKPEGLPHAEEFLTHFCPTAEAHFAAMLLRYPNSPLQDFYDNIEEPEERQNELFDKLFDSKESDSHEIFFSLQKLLKNQILAKRIFLEGIVTDASKPQVKSIVYHGKFFYRERHFPFGNLYRGNTKLTMAMAQFVAERQLGIKPVTTPTSVEEFDSLLRKILFRIPRVIGPKWVKCFLANFDPVQDALDVAMMLRHPYFPYQKIYDNIKETPERQVKIFEALFDDKRIDLHEIFLSSEKLRRNLVLVEKIFLGNTALDKSEFGVEPIVYHGKLFARTGYFPFALVYGKNPNLAMVMIRFVVKGIMGTIEGLGWLESFLRVATPIHAGEVFKLLLDHREMTPRIFETFKNLRHSSEMRDLLDKYIPFDRDVPEELLMFCALLPRRLRGVLSVFGERCKNHRPENNMGKLRAIAIDSGNRQLLSILFHQKCIHQQDAVTSSEMLEYVLKGELSPLETSGFVSYAIRNKMDLGNWPLTHLPDKYQPKEDRLSMWLCGGGVSYPEPKYSVAPGELYGEFPTDKGGPLSIYLKLTVPMEMPDGQLITRAADAFISNAQLALNKYRGDAKVRTITEADYKIIMMGTLCALMEGEHLDFSNTEAEVLKGEQAWTWLDWNYVLYNYDFYQPMHSTRQYFTSAEIYNYVHSASSNDEQIEKIIGDVAALSIAPSKKE